MSSTHALFEKKNGKKDLPLNFQKHKAIHTEIADILDLHKGEVKDDLLDELHIREIYENNLHVLKQRKDELILARRPTKTFKPGDY